MGPFFFSHRGTCTQPGIQNYQFSTSVAEQHSLRPLNKSLDGTLKESPCKRTAPVLVFLHCYKSKKDEL